MSLLDALNAGVKIADKITKPLQATVSYVRVNAKDEYGANTAASSSTPLRAIVDFKAAPVRNKEGISVVASATLTLLDVAAVVLATNGQGVDEDDEFFLPNGRRSKVLSIGGFMDAGTTKPIPLTIYLG